MATSIVSSPAPYHIISYGTLLGTSFFHSFINGPVMFKTVERPVFSAVQIKLFPIYFGLQTLLPAVLALTFPGDTLAGVSSGISGLLAPASRWHSLAPIATMFVTGLVNLVVLLPASAQTMKDRRGQAKRDGKEWYEPGPHSEEMRALSKKFGMLHGISSLLNLATYVSALAYGFTLGSRLQSIVDKV
ncbi:uncharacterized protein MAM_02453 [Metarhizium album ARSEF 1941]|uniref:TMEM205-like domain-containing protein n=1 Tax=Metarhizium album (strain ARSEF 1941) TaxID=1081103 RepID=A0A0B2X2T7_METAS|nr:uncharacterized protein MAM_02453 [Metarhizium album ARSEF 1941]KHN99600.1 hypothetical protein MAM_02453 [Metarhizium album ARSEF 1941]